LASPSNRCHGRQWSGAGLPAAQCSSKSSGEWPSGTLRRGETRAGSVVAVSHWRESVTDTDFFCADPDAVDTCAAAYQSGGEAAEALGKDLLAAQDGGEVPAEIATLVADTEAAAAGYSAAYEAWAAIGCANPLSSHCGPDEALAMFEAQGELTRQLDSWKPHLPG
jgi:hypothetical protein